MKDQVVSHKIAKLVKELGFVQEIDTLKSHYYNHEGVLDGDVSDFIWAKVRKKETKDLEPIFAPTQSLVQKFLREEFEIHIVSRPFYDSVEDKTTYVSDILAKNYPNKIIKSPRCDTYEEALEYALEKSFKLLLDEKK